MQHGLKEIERMIILKGKGYTVNMKTGEIHGPTGIIAKNIHKDGYIILTLKWQGSKYYIRGHRFVYWLKWNKLPKYLDHINGIRHDNRIDNLRAATPLLNARNRNFAKGYYWHRKMKKWEARIRTNTKNLYLGCFNTEDEAREAYLQAKKIHYNL